MMKQACDLSAYEYIADRIGKFVDNKLISYNIDCYSTAIFGKLMRDCMKETKGKANPALVAEYLTDRLNELHIMKMTRRWNEHLLVARDVRLNITPLYEYIITEINLASSIIKKKLSYILKDHSEFITHSYLCAIYGGAFNDLHSKHHGDLIEILYAIWTNILNNELSDMERIEELNAYYSTVQDSRSIITTIEYDESRGVREITSTRSPRTY